MSLVASSAAVAVADAPSELFAKPLIIGASVSADYASLSPGKRLSLRYTDKKNVETIARSGKPSHEVLPLVTDAKLKDRSIIIGLDLFFWDSANPSPEASIKGLKHLVAKAKVLRVPLILGDVPELLPGYQPGRIQINKAINEACSSGDCHVVMLSKLHLEVMRNGGLKIKTRLYRFRELVPDGLHLGDIAGEYLADYVLAAIQR